MKRKIDFENDYLVIYKSKEGKFSHFRWYSPSITPERLQEIIEKWNKAQEKKEEPQPAERITDQLIREICAYAEYSKPYEGILEELEEIKESIERAKGCLESALDDLNYCFKEDEE